MSILRCDVCGTDLTENLNESGIPGEQGQLATLCSLHHSALRRVVGAGEKVNWPAMTLATARLNRERPATIDDDAAWSRWEPLDRLAQLYEELAPVTPDDWSLPAT
jgi:hypothetical protein